jgi:hypothetical protein
MKREDAELIQQQQELIDWQAQIIAEYEALFLLRTRFDDLGKEFEASEPFRLLRTLLGEMTFDQARQEVVAHADSREAILDEMQGHIEAIGRLRAATIAKGAKTSEKGTSG